MKRVFVAVGLRLRSRRWCIFCRQQVGHSTRDANLFDVARQRPVVVDLAVRRDYEMKAEFRLLGSFRSPLSATRIPSGNTEYSFLANVLAAKGYLVASVQQDLPTDPH